MICPNCGKIIKNSATFCVHCGNKLNKEDDDTSFAYFTNTNKHRKTIIFIVTIFCFIIFFFTFRCKAGICLLPSNIKGDYCIVHTCELTNCVNRKAKDKDYCYTHSPSYSNDYNYTPEKAENVLEFSNIYVSHNSSYTVCTGKVTNNGRRTYTFVEVKGIFKNSNGTVIDTDWTYAVGSEGLAPGESASFRMSVKKDSNIKKCTIEIIDYDRK